MITLLLHVLRLLPFLFGGHRQLAVENLALRQQLAVYKRTTARPKLRTTDRLFWIWLARVWAGVEAASRDRYRRHRPAVAAAPLPRVLEQALWPLDRRSPGRPCRDQDSDHPNGHREPPLGRPTNPWRASEARYRRRRAHRLPADAEAASPAVSDVADVPRQPCRRLGRPRLLHGSHRALARPLRSRRARSPSPARRPLQRDRTPYCPLDRPADRGRLPGRLRAVLPPPRSRLGLRARVPATREGHGHRRSSDGASLPMAEPLRGAAYRLHPARMSESRPCPRRTTPAPHPGSLLRVLPPGASSPFARQGRAPRPANSAAGTRQGHPDSRSRWPPPSLRPTGRLIQPNRFATIGPVLPSGCSPPPPNALRRSVVARRTCWPPLLSTVS